MKKPSSVTEPRRMAGWSGFGAASLAIACLGLASSAWSAEPPAATSEEKKQTVDAPPPDSGSTQAEAPKKAPQVDLGEPVAESQALQVVESPPPAKPEKQEVEPEVLSSEPARAKSVDLGEPITEAQTPQPVEGTGEALADNPPATNQPTVASAGAEEQQSVAAEVTGKQESAVASAESEQTVVEKDTAAPPPASSPTVAVVKAQAVEAPEPVQPLVMLGSEVAPGTSTRLSWSPSHSFEGIAVPTPVLVVNGAKEGPVLCLTAAVHGDELNGIEIVRRVLYNLNAEKLSGTVIGVPIVNLQGFRRGSRYLPDRRDLNRFFPGDPRGSSAARIAHSFFYEVIGQCDALVDLHTGSFYRTNLPQLRADLRDQEVLELSQGFDGTVVLQSEGSPGTLRQAAVAAGIPAVTLEAGEPMRLQEQEVNHGVKTIQSLLGKLGMVKKSSFWGEPEPVYYQSAWVRADHGGILFSEVGLGERVKKDEVLGTVTDPITNVRTEILSPYRGRVLGMALNQVVMPGFAAFRIGIQASDSEVIDSAAPDTDATTTLHTSQVDKERKAAPIPVAAKPAVEFDKLEGLEDSE